MDSCEGKNDTIPKSTRLKDLSFNCILENFDRYMAAFKLKLHPLKNVEYLQRLYGSFFYEKYSTDDKLLVEYCEFLINPHLKKLHFHHCGDKKEKEDCKSNWCCEQISSYHFCHSIDIMPIVEQLKNVGKTIIEFKFCAENYPTNVLLQIVPALSNISMLELHGKHVTDSVLEIIGRTCTLLEHLDLSLCPQVSDNGLESLCHESERPGKNIKLLYLNLQKTLVTQTGVMLAIQSFPELKIVRHRALVDAICHYYYYVYKNAKKKSDPIKYNFRELDFTFCKSTDEDATKLLTSICPHVLKVTAFSSTQRGVNACAEFHSLKEIYFGNKQNVVSSNVSLTQFVELRGKNLSVLHIYGGSVSVDSVLKYCKVLQSFHIHRTAFEPFEGMEINEDAFLHNLDDIAFSEMCLASQIFADSVYYIVLSSPKLTTMYFSRRISFTAPPYSFRVTIKEPSWLPVRELDILTVNIEYNVMDEFLSDAKLDVICARF